MGLNLRNHLPFPRMLCPCLLHCSALASTSRLSARLAWMCRSASHAIGRECRWCLPKYTRSNCRTSEDGACCVKNQVRENFYGPWALSDSFHFTICCCGLSLFIVWNNLTNWAKLMVFFTCSVSFSVISPTSKMCISLAWFYNSFLYFSAPMMALYIPEEDRCLDINELIEHPALLT